MFKNEENHVANGYKKFTYKFSPFYSVNKNEAVLGKAKVIKQET